MKNNLIIILLFIMCVPYLQSKKPVSNFFSWDTELCLPSLGGQKENPGVAGAFSGIVNNNLIVLGGANFPDKMPWDGGAKQWWKTLYAFDLTNKEWEIIDAFLSKSLAYGISIQLKEGLLCIGGCDADSCFSDVFLVGYEQNKWVIDLDWPELPVTLACGTGCIYDNKIYVFGGQTSMKQQIASRYAFVLDLNAKEKEWRNLPTWPGDPKGYSVSTAVNGKVYLFSGRNYDDKGMLEVHTDGFAFNPETKTWETLSGSFPVMAGTAFTDGKENIFFTGGVEKALPTTPDHPGFSNEVKCYNVKTKSMTSWGESPYPIPVTTNLIKAFDTIYITSGEIRPGVRTPYILRGISL